MKKLLIVLFVALGSLSVKARQADEETLAKLMEGFTAALVKQDKVWLEANLSVDCTFSDPTGQTLNKADFIKVFGANGVYSISKMAATGMKYTMNEEDAAGNGSLEVEGAMSAPEVVDVSGTYNLATKFEKVGSDWKIGAITVSQ